MKWNKLYDFLFQRKWAGVQLNSFVDGKFIWGINRKPEDFACFFYVLNMYLFNLTHKDRQFQFSHGCMSMLLFRFKLANLHIW